MKKKITITKKVTLKPFMTPNFILTDDEGTTIPIHELSDIELSRMANIFKADLLLKAQSRRK